MARHIEPAVRLHADDDDDEACLLLCRDVVVFDRVRHRLILVANAVVDGRSSSGCAYRSACDSLDELEERLSTAQGEALRPATRQARSPSSPPQELMGAEAFMAGVRVLKGHIRAGEIFQGVLSEALRAPLRCDPFAVYRALRTVNPSPYMFFIDMGEQTALGASPEMLVRVEGDYVETRPIAGTRPRGGTEVDDHRNEQALRRSVKERAEHLMLVDLSRNDVGRVSRAGSVRVGSFFDVERYSHVMHLVSSVHGRLKRGCSAWAAFAACFPAGTVTGAPKIRAMQLVGELEKAPRGLYAGAVLYCDFRGNLDSAIAIRSMMVRRHGAEAIATVQSGAGIVADSQPERELSEIRNKARAMWEAVRIAEEHS
jgi:anthranilate synthase component 1